MPNFTARIVSGSAVATWDDQASLAKPSRTNPDTVPHTFQRVIAGATVVLKATVAGVEGPADAALGGFLFQAWWAEWSGTAGPPPIVQTGGSSSIATVVTNAATHQGHFLFVFWRASGGAVAIPFDVVQA